MTAFCARCARCAKDSLRESPVGRRRRPHSRANVVSAYQSFYDFYTNNVGKEDFHRNHRTQEPILTRLCIGSVLLRRTDNDGRASLVRVLDAFYGSPSMAFYDFYYEQCWEEGFHRKKASNIKNKMYDTLCIPHAVSSVLCLVETTPTVHITNTVSTDGESVHAAKRQLIIYPVNQKQYVVQTVRPKACST